MSSTSMSSESSSTDTGTSSSSGESSTSGNPVVCGDGRPDVDGVCLSEGVDFPAGVSSVAMVTGDFDGDANVDVVLSNTAGDSVVLLPGTGTGQFGAGVVTALAEGAEPQAMAAGLVSEDEVADVVVANAGNNTVSILYGSDAGFSEIVLPTGGSPGDVALADLDGDDALDFALVNAEDDVFSTWVSNGPGSFLLADVNDGGPIPFIDTIVLGPVAPDSNVDVMFSGDLVVGASPGNGDGSFDESVAVVAEIPAAAIHMRGGDLNEDGALDVAIATAVGVIVLVGDGNPLDPHFAENFLGAHDTVVDVAIADVTGEGNLDIVVLAAGDAELVVYPGLGDGSFGRPVTVAVGDAASALAVDDFDGDGRKDVVVADASTQSVTLFLSDP